CFKMNKHAGPVFSFENKIEKKENALNEIRVVGSRTHQSPETLSFIDQIKTEGRQVEIKSAGSALKFCLLAEGEADIYPRFAPTMEWDTAAGHALLKSSGKNIYVYPGGEEMQYNK